MIKGRDKMSSKLNYEFISKNVSLYSFFQNKISKLKIENDNFNIKEKGVLI